MRRTGDYQLAGEGAENTFAPMPASQVRTVAATGATMAAKGIWVGSVPVTARGTVMLRIAARSQIASVVTARPVQMICRDALPRSRPMPRRNAALAISPQSQV